jgi:tetratricopeptide (TPR) repeat protein
LKLLLALRESLAGKPSRLSEVKAALEKFEKALEILTTVPTPKDPIERAAYRGIEGVAGLGKGAALAQLGRFTEASMACDRAIESAEGPWRLTVLKLRAIFLEGAEVEQSRMPWSKPPGVVDHSKAIRMADYLVDQSGVSPPAIFNAACAFSLASLDKSAVKDEQTRRADRAVFLLSQLAAKGSFRDSKPAGNLKEDPDLDPLRNRADFQVLAEKVDGGR